MKTYKSLSSWRAAVRRRYRGWGVNFKWRGLKPARVCLAFALGGDGSNQYPCAAFIEGIAGRIW